MIAVVLVVAFVVASIARDRRAAAERRRRREAVEAEIQRALARRAEAEERAWLAMVRSL